MSSPTRATRIRTTLEAAFAPTHLRVEDDSAKHAGHAGAQPGGQTHYTVLLVSPRFENQSRVARHRLVNQALAPEFADGLHALALTLLTPVELERLQASEPV